MPIPNPHGKGEKVVDFLSRGEYTSANVTEYLQGRSPYDNLFEAAWKGLSGKRRLTYIDITDNVPLGIALGFALDPFTWIPVGAPGKIARATGVPSAIQRGVLRLAAASPEFKKAVDAGRYAARFVSGGHYASFKASMNYDEAADALKLLKVPSNLVDEVSDGTKTVDQALDFLTQKGFGAEQLDKARANLHKVRDVDAMVSVFKDMGLTNKGIQREAHDFFVDKAHVLHDADEATRLKITDLVERNAPVVKEGVAVLPSEGISLFEDVLGKQRVQEIIAEHGGTIKVAKRASRMPSTAWKNTGLNDGLTLPPAYGAMDDIAEKVTHTFGQLDIPPVHEMPEFQVLLEESLAEMNPMFKGFGERVTYINTKLVEEVQQKLGTLQREVLQNFQETTGLGWVPHQNLGKSLKELADAEVPIKRTFMARMQGVIDEYTADLKATGLADDVIEAQVTDFKYAIDKAISVTQKQVLEGADPMLEFMAEATKLMQKYPAIGPALGKMRKIIESTQQFRKAFGTLNDITKLTAEKGFKAFETNFAELMYRHEVKLKLALNYHDSLQKIMAITPDIIQPTKEGVKAAPGWLNISDPVLGHYMIKKGYEETFSSMFGMVRGTNPEWRKFLDAWDKGTGYWKYTTLIPFGKFHIRNWVSENMLNSLAGMPMYRIEYNTAAKIWWNAKINKIPEAMEQYNEMVKLGIIGGGFFASELGIKPVLVRGKIMQSKVWGAPMRTMERFGSFTEDVPRMAQFMYGKNKGAKWLAGRGFTGPTLDNAAVKYVRKFHPVYDDFTMFEEKVLRRVFPFYSWTRFNMPLHMRMFVENPSHYVRIEKMRKGITALAGGKLPEDFSPEYIQEGYAVGIGGGPNKRNYFLLKNWLPEADLLDLTSLDNMLHKGLNLLHPIKVVGEIAWAKDSFTGQKLPRVPGATVNFFGMKVNPRYVQIFKPIRAIQEVNRFWWGTDDPIEARLIYHIVGRNYEIDVKESKRYLYYRMKDMVDELNKGVSNAKRNDDPKTAIRLQAQIKKLQAEMKKLPHKK